MYRHIVAKGYNFITQSGTIQEEVVCKHCHSVLSDGAYVPYAQAPDNVYGDTVTAFYQHQRDARHSFLEGLIDYDSLLKMLALSFDKFAKLHEENNPSKEES